MKKTIALLLAFLQIAALAFVAYGEMADGEFYQETILPMPDGYTLIAMDAAPDGTIMALGAGVDGAYAFLRWRNPERLPEVAALPYYGEQFTSMQVAADGEILLWAFRRGQGAGSVLLIWVDQWGQMTARLTLQCDAVIPIVEALPGKRVAMTDAFGRKDLVIHDHKGAVLRTEASMGFQSLCSDMDTLYAFGSDAAYALPLNSARGMSKYPLARQVFGKTAVGRDGKIYMVDDGVYELILQEGKAAKRMRSMGTSLGLANTYLRNFAALPNGAFVMELGSIKAITGESGPASAFIALYRPGGAAWNPTPFVIIGMHDSALISNAASVFQRQHPELDVQIRTFGGVRTGGKPSEDIIRAINMELQAGSGGDVLILDSLPVRAMMNRGMLRDLSRLVPDLGLLPGIAKSLKHTDGKVYAIPAEFGVLVLWGREKTISSIRTLPDILKVPVGPGRVRLPFATPGIDLFITACIRDFTDNRGRINFDSRDFTTFLETLRKINSEIDVQPGVGWAVLALGTFIEAQDTALRNGYVELRPQLLSSLTLLDSYTFYGEEDARVMLMPTMRGRSKAYAPDTQLGIPVGAKNPALSEAFIRLALSEEVGVDMGRALPTVRSKLDQLFADTAKRSRDKSRNTIRITNAVGMTYAYTIPGEAFLTRLRSMLDELSEPLHLDERILLIILEELKPFYAGNITAKEAAKAMKERAKPYLDE